MPSLFLKIFLWFWATVVVTGIALILTFIFEPRSVPSRWHATLVDTARYEGHVAIDIAERDGTSAAAFYLARVGRVTHMKACLSDATGVEIAGVDCGSLQKLTAQILTSKDSGFDIRYGITRVALKLQGNGGKNYIFATELPAGPRAALGISRLALLLQWGVALLVSGVICYLLTLYLTTPIFRLRNASKQLAAGDLSTRALPTSGGRRDELGDLEREFNTMAARIEDLISGQRRLISDVSHELRSPLARLNVALDLGRKRKGTDPAFDQMEQDIELLNEMIGRLLTIAKLDISNSQVPKTDVDLNELISEIVHNADFESQLSSRGARLISTERCSIRGSAELLQSAIENVVRNAVRYTETDTSIEVTLDCECREQSNEPRIRITVRDFGPGVPESELANIFQPFYRIKKARERQSGGTGLGLAIADRVVRIHGGTIRAKNADPHGLMVEILLPRNGK